MIFCSSCTFWVYIPVEAAAIQIFIMKKAAIPGNKTFSNSYPSSNINIDLIR